MHNIPSVVFEPTRQLVQQLPYCSPYFLFPFDKKVVTVNYYGEYLVHDFKWEADQYSITGVTKESANSLPFKLDIDPLFASSSALPMTMESESPTLMLSLKNFSAGNRRFNTTKFPSTAESGNTPISPLFFVADDGSDLKAITFGNWDNTIRISKLGHFEYGTQYLRASTSIAYHTQEISCVDMDESWLVCGTVAGVLSVWKCSAKVSVLSYLGSSVSSQFRTMTRGVDQLLPPKQKSRGLDWNLNEFPFFVAYPHAEKILAVAISSSQRVVVSSCINGNLTIHNLDNGLLTHSISHDLDRTLDLIRISKDGKIAVVSSAKSNLYLYSINGALLAEKNIVKEERVYSKSHKPVLAPYVPVITCMCFTADSRFLITAGSTLVSVRRASDLVVVHEYERTESPICAICFDKDERILFVSTVDGKLVMYFKTSGFKLLS